MNTQTPAARLPSAEPLAGELAEAVKWANELAELTDLQNAARVVLPRLMPEAIAHLRTLAIAAERAGQERRAGAVVTPAMRLAGATVLYQQHKYRLPEELAEATYRAMDAAIRALPLEDET